MTTRKAAPLTFLGPRETIALLRRIDQMLATLGEHVARVAIIGSLNDAQHQQLRFSLGIVDGLRTLFADEAARSGGPDEAPPHTKES